MSLLPPTIPHWPLIGNLPELKTDLFAALTRYHQTKGDALKFHVGTKPFFLFGKSAQAQEILVKQKNHFPKAYSPDNPRGLALVLGNGLVTSSGALWQQQRRLMQPLFHKTQVATLAKPIIAHGNALVQSLYSKQTGGPIRIDQHLSKTTLNIILETMFGGDGNEFDEQLPRDMAYLLGFCQRNLFHPLPLPLWVPTPANRTFHIARARLRSNIAKLVQARERTPKQSFDLLNCLLNSNTEGEAISEALIIDECLTIFSAGHETVASALTWSIHLLTQHPSIAEKVQREVDCVLSTQALNAKVTEQLPYTRAVLEEAMRLYPPIVLLLRRANRDTHIDGIDVPAGSHTLVNLHRLHTNPAHWQQPEACSPERFLPENRAMIANFTYLPFGAGPRVCLGSHFALMEGTILLALLAHHFNFSCSGSAPIKPQLAVSLRPKDGLSVLIAPRQLEAQKRWANTAASRST